MFISYGAASDSIKRFKFKPEQKQGRVASEGGVVEGGGRNSGSPS